MGSVGSPAIVRTETTQKWWKDGSVYQIYPSSFKDSNGDGMGDIGGIISKLDYIKSIGIDIIWISPHYGSPQIDMGYDVSNYESVYPPYGTLEDMEQLIKETHARGMRIIVDLVVNHTSSEHAWFKASRSSKNDPKRDWYIWRPAKYDEDGRRMPPNNWRSMFCGSAWTWDEPTEEYYLHLFASEQPDVNWESPAARQAVYESAMEFWLRRGVDGFRIDCVNMYSKGDLQDTPVTEPGVHLQHAGLTFCNGPRMHEFLDEMGSVLAKYDTMTVGECPFTPDRNQVLSYISSSQQRLNMVFQFDVVETGSSHAHKFETMPGENWLLEFKSAVERTQGLINDTDGWTTTFLENHDWSRSISRFASDSPQYRVASGKMLALLTASLSGTLFLYQGQELGMINAPSSWPIEEFKDLDAVNYYNEVRASSSDDPQALEGARARIRFIARDNARTPMQWSAAKHAGFSEVEPWMRVVDGYQDINAEAEMQDDDSVLAFWKAMLEMRKTHGDLFVHGNYEGLEMDNNKTFCFVKKGVDRQALVVLNFTSDHQPIKVPAAVKAAKMLLSTEKDPLHREELAPFEGRVYVAE
ncbi:alpha-glucosidase [Hortaea werneckii]|nr:alpha-glucosidase [Hortaea werneckii]